MNVFFFNLFNHREQYVLAYLANLVLYSFFCKKNVQWNLNAHWTFLLGCYRTATDFYPYRVNQQVIPLQFTCNVYTTVVKSTFLHIWLNFQKLTVLKNMIQFYLPYLIKLTYTEIKTFMLLYGLISWKNWIFIHIINLSYG